MAKHDDLDEVLADCTLSPLGDPDLVAEIGVALNAYMRNAPADQRPPRHHVPVTYRVTKADGVRKWLGTILIVFQHRKTEKPWGMFCYRDGKILPGDGIESRDWWEKYGSMN